ncbi:MAG: hypothetical protein WC967_09265 [Balneolaceae bacterium]
MIDFNSLKPEQLALITFSALVVNNNDPYKRGMLQLRFPLIHDEIKNGDLPWARPDCFINGINIPRVGQYVQANFERGDKSNPVYTSQLISKDTLKGTPFEANYPHVRGLYDGKNFFIIDEKTGNITIHATGDLNGTVKGNVNLDVTGDLTANLASGSATISAPAGDVTADAMNVNITGQTSVDIDGTSMVTIDGAQVSINNGNLLVL